VLPVKVVELAETMYLSCAKRGAGVQKAVTDIDASGHKKLKHWNPFWQLHSCRLCKTERPYCCDRGGIEARQMPETKEGRCVKSTIQ
jgi:hypothetical protein